MVVDTQPRVTVTKVPEGHTVDGILVFAENLENTAVLIGQQGVVTKAIKDPFSVGQVKVLGETWSAQSEITPVEVGAKVEVLEIEGVRLIVEEME